MRRLIVSLLGLATVGFATESHAQQQWQAGYSTSGGYYGPPMPARSTEIENIGNAGQWVFGAERISSFSVDQQNIENENGDVATKQTHVTLNLFAVNPAIVTNVPRLALDYLVTDGVTVGGSLGIMNRSTNIEIGGSEGEGNQFGLLFAPRVGYAYPFNETWGIWPRLGFNYAYLSATAESTVGTTKVETKTSDSVLGLTVDAMVVLSPFKHVAILGGPYFDYLFGTRSTKAGDTEGPDLDVKYLTFGLSFAVSTYY